MVKIAENLVWYARKNFPCCEDSYLCRIRVSTGKDKKKIVGLKRDSPLKKELKVTLYKPGFNFFFLSV